MVVQNEVSRSNALESLYRIQSELGSSPTSHYHHFYSNPHISGIYFQRNTDEARFHAFEAGDYSIGANTKLFRGVETYTIP